MATAKYTVSSDGDLIHIDEQGQSQSADYSSFQHQAFVDSVGQAYLAKVSAVSDYSNEIFIQYYVRQQEWNNIVNDAQVVPTAGNSLNEKLWNDLLPQARRPSCYFALLIFYAKLLVSSLAIWLLVVKRKLTTKAAELEQGSNLCVVRSKAAESKLRAVESEFGLTLVCEDVVYKSAAMPSMLSYVPYSTLIFALPWLLIESVKDGYTVNRELGEVFGNDVKLAILNTYPARIALKRWYQHALDAIVEKGHMTALYTGNKEDRFAMVEKHIAQKYGLELVCVPHGLEYGFLFPTGIAGDKFYCTSENAVHRFAELYPDVTPVYCRELQEKLYSLGKENCQLGAKRIVFFTESRDVDVNRKIITDLKNSGLSFSLKLHPKDDKINYAAFSGLHFEEDYATAMTGVICLARKSTVLIEALFNHSLSVAYVIHSKDSYYVTSVFPSLNDTSIVKCRNSRELLEFIKNI
ncbi:hypothetical protein [Vibrio furnissii]|uniref:hypothetical protein n=1 Tax=Vibrio furnissii TaxID=29494 RepID=UPI0023DC8EEE|nr:hypothetical protein [Vibrio furnissii]